MSDLNLNSFPSSVYFSYLSILSTTISSKMVSDLNLNNFSSSAYFSYLGIQSTTISTKIGEWS